jgi:putative tryptophan/tyrosine transport system substrate-binding protein
MSGMGRREFVALFGCAAAWPIAARAQAERMRRIGVLMGVPENDAEYQAFLAAFREGLQELGWAEDRNIRIDTRWAGFDVQSMQQNAKELIALQPDLIISQSTPTTAVLKQQTSTIPIVS